MSEPANNPDPLNADTEVPKKRTRIQLSCTACRIRKLKCCRTYPCTNCMKRGEAASCSYVGRGPRAKAQHERSNPTFVQDRLQHLENLVMSLAQKQKPGDQIIDFNTGLTQDSLGYDTPASANDRDTKSPPRDTGTLVVSDEGTSYIDSVNWRAILEEINGVKEYLDEQEDNSDNDATEEDPYSDSSPVLLLGMAKKVAKQELLADIPARSVADRLISRFLKTYEPSIIVIHVPTFRKEYEQFWNNPLGMSYTWIALLYAIMALSISVLHRSEEPFPNTQVNPMSMWDAFRRKASQCLVESNYLVPGKYKPEAVYLYSLSEFFRTEDPQIGMPYLHGITIRLALRMGYHRDPSHYPSLSAFEGRCAGQYYCDSEIPSNLLDTDFDENCVHLPPGRPEEDRTACSYTRGKSRLMAAFGLICDSAYAREPVSYDEIMALDRRLDMAYDQLPSFFRARPMSQSMGEQTDLILSRYNLNLIYQKSRIVLHRRYIKETHGKYANSRRICIDAASASLRYHADIWSESLPGGQLYAERFLLNSLQNTDFMLSAMVLCLVLSHANDSGDPTRMQTREHKDLLLLLENTHKIFKQTPRRSTDTQRAFVALSIMLSRVQGRSVESLTSNVEDRSAMNNQNMFQPMSAIDQQQYPMVSPGDMQADMYTNASETPSYSSLGVIDDMLSTPAQLDWRLYDGRMYGFGTANQDSLWSAAPFIDSNGVEFTFAS
ncbi:transcriptional regulator family: Fungal Specific TF [Penicillium frequentans]|uniref:Transcriptional regulator family: Fungal Specific TF n=1 Tax=Penicillium frequentans TaxID=3151616 RepID=A0AAD6CPY6_9EURO|nr:transcriptional regulator family: Fungal Specific TF [Penicillium glabrum]